MIAIALWAIGIFSSRWYAGGTCYQMVRGWIWMSCLPRLQSFHSYLDSQELHLWLDNDLHSLLAYGQNCQEYQPLRIPPEQESWRMYWECIFLSWQYYCYDLWQCFPHVAFACRAAVANPRHGCCEPWRFPRLGLWASLFPLDIMRVRSQASWSYFRWSGWQDYSVHPWGWHRVSLLLLQLHENLHFLTFCARLKIKKELNLSDLALSLCCLGRATFVILHETSILQIH